MEEMTLKEVLVQCEKNNCGFFTVFKPKKGTLEVEYSIPDRKEWRKVAHIQTRGADPRRVFEMGREIGDSSILFVELSNGGGSMMVDKDMKFRIVE